MQSLSRTLKSSLQRMDWRQSRRHHQIQSHHYSVSLSGSRNGWRRITELTEYAAHEGRRQRAFAGDKAQRHRRWRGLRHVAETERVLVDEGERHEELGAVRGRRRGGRARPL
jgi:hypothetical protein